MKVPTLSVILPWYKKLGYFSKTIDQNRLYEDPRVEVVVPMDEPSEAESLVDIANERPHIKFRILVNDKDHDWRPPCKSINVGIRHSRGHYVAILSPETIIDPPSNAYIFRMLDVIKSSCFITGSLHHIRPTELDMHLDRYAFGDFVAHRVSRVAEVPAIGFGFLMVDRSRLVAIGCYDESRMFYGGDDDDIRIRLERSGCPQLNDSNIRLVHLFHDTVTRALAVEPFGRVLHMPDGWGMDFGKIVYDYAPKNSGPDGVQE